MLDIIVGFGGLFLIAIVGMIVWWRLGKAEEAERVRKAQSPYP